jgi:hypothetical protein
MRPLSSVVLVASLAGCAAQVDEQPVENAQQDLNLCLPYVWCSVTDVQENSDEYRGSPAWAEDGSDALAIELKYDRHWPPGNPKLGDYDTRNYQWRLFSVTPGGSDKVYRSAFRPGRAIELYYLKHAGYALAKVLDGAGGLSHVRVSLTDGSMTVLATQTVSSSQLPLEYRGIVRDFVPSPDGSVIADVSCHVSDDDPSGGYRFVQPEPCSVRFVDGAGVTTLGSWSLELAHQIYDYPPQVGDISRQPDGAIWALDGSFIVTDRDRTARRVGPGSAPVDVAVPTCTGPNTASSKISAAGVRIGIKSKTVARVDRNASYPYSFGCR